MPVPLLTVLAKKLIEAAYIFVKKTFERATITDLHHYSKSINRNKTSHYNQLKTWLLNSFNTDSNFTRDSIQREILN